MAVIDQKSWYFRRRILPVQYTDHDIEAALRSGNETIFEEVFRSYYPALCRYARSILNEPEAAEEAVQQTFIAIWEKRESIHFTVSLKAYLYRAVHNRCLNQIEKQKIRQQYAADHQQQPEIAAMPADSMHRQKELQDLIRQAIDRLPEQCGKIFRLSRFEEMKYAEIAEHLGISIKTVENQMGKALRLMREELKEYLPVLLLIPYYLYLLS